MKVFLSGGATTVAFPTVALKKIQVLAPVFGPDILGKEYEGVAAGEQLNRTGKISRFTPERMAGFIGSRQDVFNKDANFDKYVRKSNDNAVNKNKTFGRKVLNANQKP